jgi:hypothetical protein
VQDKETSLLQVRDIFLHRNIKFIQDQFNMEIKLNPSQIKGLIRVEVGDLNESSCVYKPKVNAPWDGSK